MKFNKFLLAGLLGAGLYNVAHAQSVTPNYIRSEIQSGQYSQAYTDLNSVLYAHPDSYNAYYLLAIDDGHMGNLAGAAQALQKAQVLHAPSDVDVIQLDQLQLKLSATQTAITTESAAPVATPEKVHPNPIGWILLVVVVLAIACGIVAIIRNVRRGLVRVGDEETPNGYSNTPSYSSQPSRPYTTYSNSYPQSYSSPPAPVVVNNYNNNNNLLEEIVEVELIEDIIDDEEIRDEEIRNDEIREDRSSDNSWRDSNSSNSWSDNNSRNYGNNDSPSNSWDSGSSSNSRDSGSSNSWDSGSSSSDNSW